MEDLISKSRAVFKIELEKKEISWRTCRLASMIDLILIGLTKYRSTNTQSNLIELFNTCIKTLIIYSLGEMEITKLESSQIIQEIETSEGELLGTYEKAIDEFVSFSKYSQSTLFDEETYLKVLSSLNSDYFPIDTIYSVMHLCIRQQ